MIRITDKQRDLLETIKDYIQENGYSPTVRELCELLGKRSTATIHCGLKALKKKGYIDYIYNKNRTIRVLDVKR